MKNWWNSFKTEFEARVLSSTKRVIKWVGILLIPILYAIVCILAFWNPIPNIGKAPMAFLDNEQKTLVLTNADTTNLEIYVIDPTDTSITGGSYGTIGSTDFDVTAWYTASLKSSASVNYLTSDQTTAQVTVSSDLKPMYLSAWDVLKQKLDIVDQGDTDQDTTYGFTTMLGDQEIPLNNLHYLSGQDAQDAYKDNNWYVQIQLQDNFTRNLLINLSNILASMNSGSTGTIAGFLDVPNIKVWSTFERNFIFGYYLETVNEFKVALVADLASSVLLDSVTNITDFIQSKIDEVFANAGLDYQTAQTVAAGATTIDGSEAANDLNLKEPVEETGQSYLVSDSTTTPTATIFGNVTLSEIKDDTTEAGIIESLISKINDITQSNSIFLALIQLENSLGIGSKLEDIQNSVKSLYDNRVIINRILWDYAHGLDWHNDTTKVKSSGITLKLNSILVKSAIESQIPIFKSGAMTGVPLFTNVDGDQTAFASVQTVNTNFTKFLGTNFDLNSLQEFVTMLISNIVNTDQNGIVDVEIQGIENGIYGIGLGEFFLLIGLFVGTLMQTFVFDRAKRYHKANAIQWFMSKYALMFLTGIIQTTLLVFTAAAVGWHQIGMENVMLLWLWLLLIDWVFVTLIIGLWFAIKDETIGKFLVVVYMVLNLSSGWGTFPAFMQFGFFHIVSFIVPYTYALHGMGAIIYGVGAVGSNYLDNIYILQQAGILLIFVVVFLALGLVLSRLRHKEILFGSYIAKHVSEALETLGQTTLVSEFRQVKAEKGDKVTYKYNWKALGTEWREDLYWKVRELHPFEGKFKWFKNEAHDKELKPNYSDDDIISRNE